MNNDNFKYVVDFVLVFAILIIAMISMAGCLQITEDGIKFAVNF